MAKAEAKSKSGHAPLECPECGHECKPQYDLKDGGASYLCRKASNHSDFRPLRFRIDGDGEVYW